MKRFAASVVLVGLLTFLLPLAASAVAGEPGTPVQNDRAEVKALQKERIETLAEIVKIVEREYTDGRESRRGVMTAQLKLLDAKVEAADTLEERVARLEEMLTLAKKALELDESRYRTGAGAVYRDVLETKSSYLGVKIRLAKERAKLKPQGK